MTITEFDVWVETADESFVYELHDGVVYAFASGSTSHGLLASRLGTWAAANLKPPCNIFFGSISVRRDPERPSSVIPDLVVTCEQAPAMQIYVTSPKLVVEVISPRSVTNDLVRKPRVYDAVPSCEEYLLVDSRAVWAKLMRRDADGGLTTDGEDVVSPDATITLETVGLSFTLAELYAGILAE
jgi:Uma2 family endonuclease